jgi:hypothetical protein
MAKFMPQYPGNMWASIPTTLKDTARADNVPEIVARVKQQINDSDTAETWNLLPIFVE